MFEKSEQDSNLFPTSQDRIDELFHSDSSEFISFKPDQYVFDPLMNEPVFHPNNLCLKSRK